MTIASPNVDPPRLLSLAVWLNVAVVTIAAMLVAPSWIGFFGIALGLAIMVEAVLLVDRPRADVAIAAALISQCGLLTAAFAGHPWQVDTHMYFFAVMAMLSALQSVRALIVGAGLVAVHHLTLNFVLPSLVYPGGSDLMRTIMHAVILIIETAVLIYAVVLLKSLLRTAEHEKTVAQDALETAEHVQSQRTKDEERRTNEQAAMLAVLDAEFSSMVEHGMRGDFSPRINHSFAFDAYNNLADRLNALFETTDSELIAMEQRLQRLTKGDLRANDCPSKDAASGRFAECSQMLDDAIAQLAEIIALVGHASQASKSAADRINAGTRDLSTRSSQQIEALRVSATSMQNMAHSGQQTRDHLTKADSLAGSLGKRVDEGRVVMETAIASVLEIEKSSKSVTEIISVIEAISFQTNLLALNAAVEAARAGESGKGFAVVASEVRSLAQRSSEAAAEITKLINESVRHTGDGVAQVKNSGEMLGDITELLHEMTAVLAEVVSSGLAQSATISEVAEAVSRLEGDAEAAADSTDQNRTAAETITKRINELDNRIKGFIVEAEAAAAAA